MASNPSTLYYCKSVELLPACDRFSFRSHRVTSVSLQWDVTFGSICHCQEMQSVPEVRGLPARKLSGFLVKFWTNHCAKVQKMEIFVLDVYNIDLQDLFP
jgi:hypothetical protein